MVLFQILFYLIVLVGFWSLIVIPIMIVLEERQRNTNSFYFYKKLHKEIRKIVLNLEKYQVKYTNEYSGEIISEVLKDFKISIGYKIEKYRNQIYITREK